MFNPDKLIGALERVLGEFGCVLQASPVSQSIVVFDKADSFVCKFVRLHPKHGPNCLEIGKAYEAYYSTDPETRDKEEWFEIQWSHKGADDWFKIGPDTIDTLKTAKERLAAIYSMEPFTRKYDYRIVRITRTETVENDVTTPATTGETK